MELNRSRLISMMVITFLISVISSSPIERYIDDSAARWDCIILVLTLVLCVIYMRVSNFVIKSNKKTFWVKKCKDEFGATLIVKKLLKKTTTYESHPICLINQVQDDFSNICVQEKFIFTLRNIVFEKTKEVTIFIRVPHIYLKWSLADAPPRAFLTIRLCLLAVSV